MTTPYYQDDSVTLYHGLCRDVLAAMPDRSVDAVLTDPPYTERTHSAARSNKEEGPRTRAVRFAAMSEDELSDTFSECARVSKGWVVATLAYQHAFAFDEAPPTGLRCLRIGVWVKTNPMPQISADRPGQGWESIAYLHRDDVKPAWNGGGRAGKLRHPSAARGGAPDDETSIHARRLGAQLHPTRRRGPGPFRWQRHDSPSGSERGKASYRRGERRTVLRTDSKAAVARCARLRLATRPEPTHNLGETR